EPSEDLTVSIATNASGINVAQDTANGTIEDDDTPTEITRIHAIQGTGANVVSGTYTVEAIVVGDFQASDQLRGFFIQEEDADVDADPLTSEGIFVFCGSCSTDVVVGDLVQATGLAEDFFDMSQIDVTGDGASVTVISSENALPTPATVTLSATGGDTEATDTFEQFEGMLVTFPQELVVSEYFELARYGQLVLTETERPAQFTDANEPSDAGYATFLEELAARRIILDDDNNIQNDPTEVGADEPYFYPRPGLSTTNFVRGGDSITNLTGVMHWSFAGQSGTNAWRIRPVEPAFSYAFTSNNPRTAQPADVGGSLTVASFNVLNYFTSLNDGTNPNARGANSASEFTRQGDKIAAAICAMNADIVGLIEIENNGSTALEALIAELNEVDGCADYAYVNTGVIGGDAIAVAFIYRTDTVELIGAPAVLDTPDFVSPFGSPRNRPALAQTFQEIASEGVVTVVVNHLKSKGSGCGAGDDATDGSGNCDLTRTVAAQVLVDWLATDPTNSGDEDFLIIGDLNSYRNERPIDAIEVGADDTLGTNDDFTDLIDSFLGAGGYGYVFDGQRGYLDYAMANTALFPQVTGITSWHINADEIPVLDYNDDILDAEERSFERESAVLPVYSPDPYRSSDHDPVIVGLNLTVPVTDGTVTVIKEVVNDDDGTGVVSNFPLFLVNDGEQTAVLSGVSETVAPGIYSVTETMPAGMDYTATFSGDCDANGNITVEAGDDLTCTITNDDVPVPDTTITVTKVVVNDDGGTGVVADFPLFLLTDTEQIAVVSGVAQLVEPGTYSVAELLPEGMEYTATFSGDCDANGNITAEVGDTLTCTITNDDVPEDTDDGLPLAQSDLDVCWIEDPNGNTSAWQVTNDNPVPLAQDSQAKVLFDWAVYSGDSVLQSAMR
ncbi:MAG: ExeM/NucH family extracellular endonuclease, partial [Chloroflexota bacterium]